MSAIYKLEKAVKIYESMDQITHVNEIVSCLKKSLREMVGGSFVKVSFAESENNGILFVKFSKHPFKEATNDQLVNSPTNFIISIDGFNPDGTIKECVLFEVETCVYKNKINEIKKIRKKSFYNPESATEYVKKYFEKYKSYFMTEEGEGGIGGGGEAVSSDVSGGTSSGNIAAYKKKLVQKPIRRKKDEE
jgi:hypothetical protein